MYIPQRVMPVCVPGTGNHATCPSAGMRGQLLRCCCCIVISRLATGIFLIAPAIQLLTKPRVYTMSHLEATSRVVLPSVIRVGSGG